VLRGGLSHWLFPVPCGQPNPTRWRVDIGDESRSVVLEHEGFLGFGAEVEGEGYLGGVGTGEQGRRVEVRALP
jgi:hypothetical protein